METKNNEAWKAASEEHNQEIFRSVPATTQKSCNGNGQTNYETTAMYENSLACASNINSGLLAEIEKLSAWLGNYSNAQSIYAQQQAYYKAAF